MCVVTEEDTQKLRLINNKYPKTMEWIKHKCNWEQASMGKILHDYENYIDKLMQEEYN